MEWWLLGIAFFISFALLLILGLPIGFSLGTLAVFGSLFLWKGTGGVQIMALTAYAISTNFVIVAVPLFILLAEVTLFSGISEDAFEAAYKWFGQLPGGLAVAGVAACALFAAITGASSANTATIGLVAVPEMLKKGYSKYLAIGSITAGGALGIIIPPSIPMILYGTLAEVSIGKLFMSGFLPGIMIAIMFSLYIVISCIINPSLATRASGVTWKEKFVSLKKVWAAVLLAVFMLVAIYTGIATPTEVAGVGAFLTFLIAIVYRRLNWKNLKPALLRTVQTTCFVLWILIGALCFGYILTYAGIPQKITEAMVALPVNRWVIIILINLMFLFLGCFIDPGSIILITTPIVLPIILKLGFDPLWFGLIFIINMAIGNITPPFGINLFVMKGIVPEDITIGDIIKGSMPYVVLYLFGLALCIVFPQIPMFLPNLMK